MEKDFFEVKTDIRPHVSVMLVNNKSLRGVVLHELPYIADTSEYSAFSHEKQLLHLIAKAHEIVENPSSVYDCILARIYSKTVLKTGKMYPSIKLSAKELIEKSYVAQETYKLK